MEENNNVALTEGQTTESTTEATVVDQSTGDAVSETSYANGKYKSVGELEKGYIEAQKYISSKLGGFTGAPEEYSLPEGTDNSEFLGKMMEWGREKQLSDEGFGELVGMYQEYISAENEAFQKQEEQRIQAELSKLGENADRMITNIRDKIVAQFGEETMKALEGAFQNAESIKVLDALIKGNNPQSPANAPAQPVDPEKIRAMRFEKDEFGNRRMSTDPKFRQRVIELEAQLKGSPVSYVVN